MRGYQFAVLLGILGSSMPAISYADGCYLCQGGGYVEFKGEDTFAKRREAKEKFACVVQGTASTCTRPKGSVGGLVRSKQNLATLERRGR